MKFDFNQRQIRIEYDHFQRSITFLRGFSSQLYDLIYGYWKFIAKQKDTGNMQRNGQ